MNKWQNLKSALSTKFTAFWKPPFQQSFCMYCMEMNALQLCCNNTLRMKLLYFVDLWSADLTQCTVNNIQKRYEQVLKNICKNFKHVQYLLVPMDLQLCRCAHLHGSKAAFWLCMHLPDLVSASLLPENYCKDSTIHAQL